MRIEFRVAQFSRDRVDIIDLKRYVPKPLLHHVSRATCTQDRAPNTFQSGDVAATSARQPARLPPSIVRLDISDSRPCLLQQGVAPCRSRRARLHLARPPAHSSIRGHTRFARCRRPLRSLQLTAMIPTKACAYSFLFPIDNRRTRSGLSYHTRKPGYQQNSYTTRYIMIATRQREQAAKSFHPGNCARVSIDRLFRKTYNVQISDSSKTKSAITRSRPFTWGVALGPAYGMSVNPKSGTRKWPEIITRCSA